MIFDLTKSYVPESYTESRDYRVFLHQLSSLLTVFKYEIDRFPALYIADECPSQMLPLLASMVGYEYKDSRSIDSNRKVIKEFPYLIRYRGSELGLRAAVVLCINTSPAITHYYSADSIIIDTDVENGIITVYYPRVDLIDWDLIEVVRPVGMKIILEPSDTFSYADEFHVEDKITVTKRHKSQDQSIVGTSVSDGSKVGYSVNEYIEEEEGEGT